MAKTQATSHNAGSSSKNRPMSTRPTSSPVAARNIVAYIATPLLAAFLSMNAPILLVLIPVAFLPTAALYAYYRRIKTNSSSRIKGSSLLTIYLFSGTIGILLVVLSQTILAYIAGTVIFGSELDDYMKEFGRSESELEHADPALISKRAIVAAQPQYWIFLVVMMFGIVATTEELLKYISLPLALKYLFPPKVVSVAKEENLTSSENNDSNVNSNTGDEDADADADTNADSRQALINPPTREKVYIPIIVAATLGFSTLENIGFIYNAAIKNTEPPLRLLQTVLERLFLSSPGHVLTALYLGIGAIERDFKSSHIHAHAHTHTHTHTHTHGTISSHTTLLDRFKHGWVRILAAPMVFHGTFDFILLAVSALNGNPGWIHPRSGRSLYFAATGVISLQMTLALLVRRDWIRLGIRL